MFEKYSRSDIKHENKIRNFFGNALSTSSFKYIKFLSVTDNSCLASKFCLISFSYPIISTFLLKTVQIYQQPRAEREAKGALLNQHSRAKQDA